MKKFLANLSRWRSKLSKSDCVFLLLGALLIAGLLFFLGKDVSYDFLHYQFYNAYAVLTGRLGSDFFPVGLHSTLNPLVGLIPYLLIAHTNTAVVFIFWWLVEVALWLAIFVLVRAVMAYLCLWSAKKCFPVLSLVNYGLTTAMFFTATVLGELGANLYDSHLSLFLVLALIVVLKRRQRWWSWLVMGVLFGAATGAKLTFAPYGVALVVAVLIASWKNRQQWRVALKTSSLVFLGEVIGFLLTAAWWMCLMSSHFQSPIFPYFNNIFRSELALTETSYRDERYGGWSLGEGALLPFRWLGDYSLVSEQFFFNLNITLAYVVVLAAFVWWLVRRQSWRRTLKAQPKLDKFYAIFKFTLVFWLLSYTLWLKVFAIYRYLSFLEIISPLTVLVLIAAALKLAGKQFSLKKQRIWRKIGLGVLMSLMVASLLPTIIPNWGRLPWHSGKYWQIDQVTLPSPSKSTIFVYREALGFVLPFLPPEARLVRIQGSVLDSFDEVQLHDVLTKTQYWQDQLSNFAAVDDDFYLLKLLWRDSEAAHDVAELGFEWDEERDCQLLTGQFFETAYYPVQLCTLHALAND